MTRRLMLTALLLAMSVSLASCGFGRVVAPITTRHDGASEIGRSQPSTGGDAGQSGGDEQPISGRH